MKKLCILLLVCLLTASCALPAFAADAGKTPVFDNVRTELTIAYAGKGSEETKYVVAIASIPNGDAVGYELYHGDTLVGTFTQEPPYVTLDSPAGDYRVVAYNQADPAFRTESGVIHIEVEQVTPVVRLREALKALYLDVTVYGFLFVHALSALPARLAAALRQLFAGLQPAA